MPNIGLDQIDQLQEAGPSNSMCEGADSTCLTDAPILHSFECSDDKTPSDIADDCYTSDVMKNLDEARKKGDFCDITLLIGPEKQPIKAHRLILASASDYFRVMFTSDLKESRQSEVELCNTDLPTMTSLIDFLYSGKMQVTDDTIEKILTTANFFGLSKIVKKCVEHVQAKMNNANSIEILEFAERISNQHLKKIARKFVIQNFETISSKNLDIMAMNTRLLLEIIKHAATSIHSDPVENEERLFQIGWNHLQSKPADVLETFLPKLLKAVHLPCVSDDFLQDLKKRVTNSKAVNKLLESAKRTKSTLKRNSDEADMSTLRWAMGRLRQSGTLSVVCEGFKNDSSLEWWGMPVYISGIPWRLWVRIETNTDDGPPINYIQAFVGCMSSFDYSKSIPCNYKLILVAPKNQNQKQDCEIADVSETFTPESNCIGPVRGMRVIDVLRDYYDTETDSCTVKAQITMESETIYVRE